MQSPTWTSTCLCTHHGVIACGPHGLAEDRWVQDAQKGAQMRQGRFRRVEQIRAVVIAGLESRQLGPCKLEGGTLGIGDIHIACTIV